MGLGHLPLWPLGLEREFWVDLGPAHAMGPRLGFLAARSRICRLGAFAAVGEEIASADAAIRDATRKQREIDRQIAQLEAERKAKKDAKGKG